MSAVDKILNYWSAFMDCHCEAPKVIPITDEERRGVYQSLEYYCQDRTARDHFRNADFERTPFAEEIRARRLSLPITRLSMQGEESELLASHETSRSELTGHLVRRITAYIASDDSSVEVELEWDYWAWLKRKLRLTKRFPIRKKRVRIDGRVIYPKLKVQLPHERHFVKLKVRIPA